MGIAPEWGDLEMDDEEARGAPWLAVGDKEAEVMPLYYAGKYPRFRLANVRGAWELALSSKAREQQKLHQVAKRGPARRSTPSE